MAKTVRTNMTKVPAGKALSNPGAPFREQVKVWRSNFLTGRFFLAAVEELPLMVVARIEMDGEDVLLAGVLPDKEQVSPFIEHLLDRGATWVASIMEAYTYVTEKQGEELVKIQGTKQESLIIAAYAEGWQEIAVQPFRRIGGRTGLPVATAELVVHGTDTGTNLTGGMIPFSDPSKDC